MSFLTVKAIDVKAVVIRPRREGLLAQGADELAELALDEVDAVAEPVVVVALALGFLLEAAAARVHAGRERVGLVVVRLPLRGHLGRARGVARHESEVRVAPGRRLRVWRALAERVVVGVLLG